MSDRRFILIVFLVFWLLGGGSAAARDRESSSPRLSRRTEPASDAWLVKRVRHELLMLPYYSIFDDIEYRIRGYHVDLYGEVVDPTLRPDAERAVRRIEGVESVTNHIEVLPVSNFDDRIRLATARAIYGYAPLQRYGLGSNPSIHIIVRNGNVRLVGVVDSRMDRQLAYMQARSVPGVFSVTDELKID